MKRDPRVVQSEAAILEAGIRTFLANPSAGMSEIAQASGVGRTTLYRHYPSRESLARAIALRCFDEIDDALRPLYEAGAEATVPATFEALIPLADRYRFLSALWPEVEADPLVARRTQDSRRDTHAWMDHAQARGEVASDLPAEWLAEFFETTLYAAWSLLERRAITREDAVRFATRSFLRGCGP